VIVHREEIYVKIQEENRKASKSIKNDLASMVNLIKKKIKGKGADQTDSAKIDYKDRLPKGGRSRRGSEGTAR
jgi:hypothetical protein